MDCGLYYYYNNYILYSICVFCPIHVWDILYIHIHIEQNLSCTYMGLPYISIFIVEWVYFINDYIIFHAVAIPITKAITCIINILARLLDFDLQKIIS